MGPFDKLIDCFFLEVSDLRVQSSSPITNTVCESSREKGMQTAEVGKQTCSSREKGMLR